MKAIVFTGYKHDLNVAAIIRTADGLGFDEVIIQGRKDFPVRQYSKKSLKDWVDYKPKLRFFSTIEEVLGYVQGQNYSLVSMELDAGARAIDSFRWPDNPAIFVGHENNGVPKIVMQISEKVMLPMRGNVKCMNVACAASIAMYDHFIKSNGRD